MPLYGVSFGNGNDGVSQLFPDYYVTTDDPWLLARIALVENYVDPVWKKHAREEVSVDGDEDFTISATLYEGPKGETQFDAAEAIVEVFPVDSADVGDNPDYDSLDAAFGEDVVASYCK